jgi:hypothetical protein
MAVENADSQAIEDTDPPRMEDVSALCRRLNELDAKYVVVGGLAMQQAGYLRATMDVDLIIDVHPDNEAKVLQAASEMPEHAAAELKVGEVAEYTVVRIGDVFTLDLMKSACGMEYHEIAQDAVIREILGVAIPFASPKKLWLMKQTYREKDAADRLFLRQLLGDDLPATPPRAQL